MTLYEFCMQNADATYLLDQFYDNEYNVHNISSGSNKKVTWHCNKCGYTWRSTVYSRTSRLDRCLGCTYLETGYSNKLLVGFNDLHTYCRNNPDVKYVEDELLLANPGIDTSKIASSSNV